MLGIVNLCPRICRRCQAVRFTPRRAHGEFSTEWPWPSAKTPKSRTFAAMIVKPLVFLQKHIEQNIDSELQSFHNLP